MCLTLRAQNSGPQSYPAPDARFKADLLLIVAHPDDETAIGSYLAKAVFDEHRRVAIVYCNRGNGGGNSAGAEQSTSLGAIREIEARKAVARFGIENVWFLEGRDTPAQDLFASLELWHHGKILEDVVRIVRLTEADVIITWLPQYVVGENHGDHQASGVIATEAFDCAGDPTVFPEQVTPPRERIDINNLTEGLHAWQPKKIYYFSDASHPMTGAGPKFDISGISPTRKLPYYQLAAQLHTPHLTQADVSQSALDALKSGDFTQFKKWLESFNLIFGKAVVPCRPEGGIFDGVTPAPHAFVPPAGYRAEEKHGISLELGGVFAFYRDFWKAHDIAHVASLVGPEIGVAGGSYVHVPLLIRNDTPDSVEVTLSAVVPRDWTLEGGAGTYRLGPATVLPAQTFFRAPAAEGHETQEITWKAVVGRKSVGSVTLKVTLSQWALPQ